MYTNFIKLSEAVVNVEQIVSYSRMSVHLTDGKLVQLTAEDYMKLHQKIFGEEPVDSTPVVTTTTTSSADKMTVKTATYKMFMSVTAERNRLTINPYSVKVDGDEFIITRSGHSEQNRYTYDGMLIEDGLNDDRLNSAIAEKW